MKKRREGSLMVRYCILINAHHILLGLVKSSTEHSVSVFSLESLTVKISCRQLTLI